MCRVLGVSPSGYYDWTKREPSGRDLEDAYLTNTIFDKHAASRGTYGAPRIHQDLIEEGHRVGRKRVARLMREAGIRGVCRRKSRRTTIRSKTTSQVPDRVKREFQADGPDQLWVADVTYIPTWAGFLFLAVVIDVWSRKVIGWSMATHMRTELVMNALNMAITTRQPGDVIHHSDHGSQYTSLAFGRRCEALGIQLSMGSVGDCFDNAMAESFFASLECELIDRSVFRTTKEARLAVFDYIEGFYNPQRRHSSIGMMSPVRFEQTALLPCAA
jgi:putative transposase